MAVCNSSSLIAELTKSARADFDALKQDAASVKNALARA
jgi:hypothetical protein